MWHSDNARTHEVQVTLDRARLNRAFAADRIS
jgi:hypothetical protein